MSGIVKMSLKRFFSVYTTKGVIRPRFRILLTNTICEMPSNCYIVIERPRSKCFRAYFRE
jgi:hypothetical protein